MMFYFHLLTWFAQVFRLDLVGFSPGREGRSEIAGCTREIQKWHRCSDYRDSLETMDDPNTVILEVRWDRPARILYLRQLQRENGLWQWLKQ